jgi:carboxyl-terminal processing protease
MLDNNIGYIKISSFNGGCASEFKKVYEDIKNKSAKSLIIDLRNNGGGLVDQSLSIADMIVPKGSTMLITSDKNGKEVVEKSDNDPTVDIPIVILVNEYTASASEILTAAIRENTNAKVIGTNTYGKGVIQGIYLLQDKKTGMKITINEYFTPNHNKINKVGIKPDEIVELPDELKGYSNIEKNSDTQLKRAVEILK